ncbi:MAG: uroporphyrinogen decarboxylase family protein [Acutalibacteraceae bacterium]
MNKTERMKAVFENREPDRVPAGFWFHYPGEMPAGERAQAHVDLCRKTGADIIKVMDDNFGRFFTQGIQITKPSDWRKIRLPGKDCAHYRGMTELIGRILEKAGGEAMVFPTVWSPFKIASFTYLCAGGTDQQFMAHCREDPDSVLEGVKILADTLQTWTRDYLELGSSGIYYSGQFSEPQRFDGETWEKLVKPSDLAVLGVTKEFAEKYNIVHICGEVEFGFQSSPRRYAGYPGDLFNWDVHRTDLSLEAGRAVFQKPILGGLDNHGVLIEGSLEEIRAETERIIRSMGKRGFMLGADCTVPASIDWARLRAAVEAAEQA